MATCQLCQKHFSTGRSLSTHVYKYHRSGNNSIPEKNYHNLLNNPKFLKMVCKGIREVHNVKISLFHLDSKLICCSQCQLRNSRSLKFQLDRPGVAPATPIFSVVPYTGKNTKCQFLSTFRSSMVHETSILKYKCAKGISFNVSFICL